MPITFTPEELSLLIDLTNDRLEDWDDYEDEKDEKEMALLESILAKLRG